MWRNKAVSDTYEPGSTFKIFTSAIALEENLVTTNSSFYCNGAKNRRLT
jgi:stage V sporulation protein D (sporulation-specific penicillin-binding protein)